MHELSIAQSIVELAEQEAQNHYAVSIEELELEIGTLAGIDPVALQFALESAIKGSRLENALIIKRFITGEGRCGDCEHFFSMENLLSACPFCGSYVISIIKGKELRIKSIIINNNYVRNMRM